MIIGTMEIRLLADIARLQRGMDEARQVVSATSGAIGRIADGMKTALVGAFTSMKAIEAAGALIETQRAFDKLNGSLVTATGSAANAAQAYKALQAFAANTPFGLGEVTEGFVKLRNLGLTPSERALNSYGNTASAMSKSMNQMIEAVADAATGEFERLKEFGIKAKQNGDQVSLTFQGVTTNIANNAGAIEQYLIRLGETNFGGAMERQSRTLDGAISNLGDTWEATKLKFAQGGFGDAAQSNTLGLTAALTDLGAILDVVSGAASKEGAAVQEASLLHKSLTTVFETVAVLGLNVAYVFTQVGKELGGLAAQAAAVATGEFALAKQIGVQMRADAEAARSELDKKTAGILVASETARKAAEAEAAAKKAAGRDDLAKFGLQQQAAKRYMDELNRLQSVRATGSIGEKEYIRLVSQLATETWKASDAGKAAADAATKNAEAVKKATAAREAALKTAQQFTETQAREIAQVGLAEDQIKMMAAAHAAALAPTEALRLKIMENALALDIKTKAQKDSVDAEAAAALATFKADEALYDATAGVWNQVAAMEKQVDLYGMTAEQVLRLQSAKLQADLAMAEGDEKKVAALTLQIQGTERLIELNGMLVQNQAATKMGEDALAEQRKFWESIDRTAHDTFVSIMDGGKGAAQRLRDAFKNVFYDWLYQMTLKKWIVNLQGQFSTSGQGVASLVGGGGGGGGGGGIGSMLQTGKGVFDAINTGFTGLATSIGGMVSTVGNFFGSSSISAFGAGMGMSGSQAAAAAQAYNAAGMTGTGSAITSGSMVGGVATAAAGIAGGVYGGRMISGGYSAFGGSGNSAVNTGTAIGAAVGSIIPVLGTAVGALIGGLIGGAANRLFGHKPKEYTEQNIVGNLGASGFTGDTVSKWIQKGGVFRSDKTGTDVVPVDGAMAASFAETYEKLKGISGDFAKTLGADISGLASRSQAVAIAIGKDQAANEKAIADFFTGVGDTLARELIPNLNSFSAEGESAAGTLQRLAVQYTAVDAILKAMGATGESAFGVVGVASLAARERLLTLTGGIDALASQTSFFAQNFLTEAERLAPVQDQVTAKMMELGLAGVTTNDAFKSVVLGLTQSGALATEVGATTYAELLKIAPTFKLVADAAAAAAQVQAETAQLQAETARKVAEDASRKASEDAAAAAQKLADINKPYQDSIAELQVALGYASAARATELEVMDASTRSLYEHEQGLLAEKAARDKRNAEYEAYVAKVAQDEQDRQAQALTITQQRAAMEIQLYELTHTAAENVAAARVRELAATDALLVPLREQIYASQDLAAAATAAAKEIEDAAARAKAVASERAGIERSILQLQGNTGELRKLELAALAPENRARQEAYYALQDKMAAEQAAAAQAQAMAEAQAQAAEEARRAEEALKAARQSATDSIFDQVKQILGLIDGAGATSLAGAQSAFAIATAQARAGDLDAMKALPGLSKSLLDLAEQNAKSLLDLRRIQAQTAGSLAGTASGAVGQYGLTIPAYAEGTNQITRTGLALVHQGEEIVPAASNGPYRSPGTDMNAVLAELRALREEVASFHRDNSSENSGIARDGKRVADGLEQVTDGFDAMRTREEA